MSCCGKRKKNTKKLQFFCIFHRICLKNVPLHKIGGAGRVHSPNQITRQGTKQGGLTNDEQRLTRTEKLADELRS